MIGGSVARGDHGANHVQAAEARHRLVDDDRVVGVGRAGGQARRAVAGQVDRRSPPAPGTSARGAPGRRRPPCTAPSSLKPALLPAWEKTTTSSANRSRMARISGNDCGEGGVDARIEVAAHRRLHDRQRLFLGPGRAVGAIRGQRVEHVGDGHDPRLQAESPRRPALADSRCRPISRDASARSRPPSPAPDRGSPACPSSPAARRRTSRTTEPSPSTARGGCARRSRSAAA